MRYTHPMGRGQTAIARDQFSAIFGERRSGNPDAPSIEEEGTVLDALRELRDSSFSSLGPALAILKTSPRRDGLYAELAKAVKERAARTATCAVGMQAACEFGVFDVTGPMVERWCEALIEYSARQVRYHAPQPVGPNSNPARTPLLEWLHSCEGLEAVLADPAIREGLFEQIKDFIGPEGLGEKERSQLDRQAAEIWGGLFASATVRWLEGEPGDPLLASIICSEADRRELEAAQGGSLPRVVDVFDRAELSKRFEELLALGGTGGDDPGVNIYETPHHLDLSNQLWPHYAATLLGAHEK